MVLDILLWLLGLIYTASTIGSIAAIWAISYAVYSIFRYKHPDATIVKHPKKTAVLLLGLLMCVVPVLNTVSVTMLFAAGNEIRDTTLASVEERCGVLE